MLKTERSSGMPWLAAMLLTTTLPTTLTSTAISKPPTPPITPIIPASERNMPRTSAERAPRAFKIPISRVRSSTAVYIVFAMPRQATTKAIAARPDSPMPRIVMNCPNPLRKSLLVVAW